MRRFLPVTILCLNLLFASCAPQPVSVVEPIVISSPTISAHPREINFALVGDANALPVNVWELFDESGATYAGYAVRSEYWPRLYHLVPPARIMEPLAADGMPAEVIQHGDFYTATIPLRTDLKWTDDSPFSAEDVAFTINTAIAFELGYDWNTYYSSEYIDHIEAVNASTVRYYFKRKPNVGVWQYGALQGPIVQKAFWESSVDSASKLLPDDTLHNDIDEARTSLAATKLEYADLEAQVLALKLNGKQNRILDADYRRVQGELVYIQSNLDILLENYNSQLKLAQRKLYSASGDGEPLLGTWLPAGNENGALVNQVNPAFPFLSPNFDRAVYKIFPDETSAVNAFQSGKVNFILSTGIPSWKMQGAKNFPGYGARFLVFNPLSASFANSALRAALDCMIDRSFLTGDFLQGRAYPLDSFVLSPQWHDPVVKSTCTGMEKPVRIQQAVFLLKDAGYAWAQEPNANSAGLGLFLRQNTLPNITLLAPSNDEDPLRHAASQYIAEQAQYLGMSVVVQDMNIDDLVYRVYSSQKYDMALMGWRLSEYPSYLCEWVGGENQYLYNSSRLKSECDALGGEPDLGKAQGIVHQIESALVSEVPFIPLFTEMQADIYRGLSYPEGDVLSGWNGLYGAPSYALPVP
jgi:ABC-type transport system substrate-binding protein